MVGANLNSVSVLLIPAEPSVYNRALHLTLIMGPFSDKTNPSPEVCRLITTKEPGLSKGRTTIDHPVTILELLDQLFFIIGIAHPYQVDPPSALNDLIDEGFHVCRGLMDWRLQRLPPCFDGGSQVTVHCTFDLQDRSPVPGIKFMVRSLLILSSNAGLRSPKIVLTIATVGLSCLQFS